MKLTAAVVADHTPERFEVTLPSGMDVTCIGVSGKDWLDAQMATLGKDRKADIKRSPEMYMRVVASSVIDPDTGDRIFENHTKAGEYFGGQDFEFLAADIIRRNTASESEVDSEGN